MCDGGNAPLWTIGEIRAAVDGHVLGLDNSIDGISVESVSIDSRTLEKGALYVAIKGVSQDGHLFIPAAFKVGAVAALVGRDYQHHGGQGVLIQVEDTLLALGKLARAARARSKAKVIAVTGSAGKTGTKEALKEMLSPSGRVHVSVKSYNNHWGVPLSLARMPLQTDFAVFEVGMNHAGEIEPLSRLIQPDVALITTVAPVHIGHFQSEEEIADAKAEIYAGLRPAGGVILPRGNKHFARLQAAARRINETRLNDNSKESDPVQIFSFGTAEGADIQLTDAEFGLNSTAGRVKLFGKDYPINLNIPGAHIADNLIGALGAAALVGADVQAAINVFGELNPPEGRGGRHDLACEGGRFLLIDESYNANPISMEIALKNLAVMDGSAHFRRIAVLGDMLELGAQAERYHKELGELVNELDIDLVFAAGERMTAFFNVLGYEKQGMHVIETCDLVEPLVKLVRPGDAVLVKGSNASNMALIVKALAAMAVGENGKSLQ